MEATEKDLSLNDVGAFLVSQGFDLTALELLQEAVELGKVAPPSRLLHFLNAHYCKYLRQYYEQFFFCIIIKFLTRFRRASLHFPFCLDLLDSLCCLCLYDFMYQEAEVVTLREHFNNQKFADALQKKEAVSLLDQGSSSCCFTTTVLCVHNAFLSLVDDATLVQELREQVIALLLPPKDSSMHNAATNFRTSDSFLVSLFEVPILYHQL